MTFKYELIAMGDLPTFDNKLTVAFANPVSVGEKVKTDIIGSELLTVAAIEHYPKHSVLYYCETS